LRQEDVNLSNAVACVNGYYIFSSDVENVYNEYKEAGISRNRIIEDSISEILVVQCSKRYGISISDKELDTIMMTFKISQPDLFEESLAQYGEHKLKEKLYIRNLFSKTKKHITENILLKNGVPYDAIDRFVSHYGLEKQLSPYSDEQILRDLGREIEAFLFNEWLENLREGAIIEYFDVQKDSFATTFH
jgi:Zn-finger nucleic acid-binding protein